MLFIQRLFCSKLTRLSFPYCSFEIMRLLLRSTYLPMTHFLQDLWSAMHSLMLPRDKKRSIKNLVKYLDDIVNAHHIQKFGEQIGYCTKRKPEHWYFVTKIVLTYCEKNFGNLRLKAMNLQNL